MIICDECGTKFEPMTDAFRCPVCGTENYPEDDDYEEFFEDPDDDL